MPLPSWLQNPDAGLLNKASWRISALLAGTLALVAVYLNQGGILLPGDPSPQPVSARANSAVPAGSPAGRATNGEPVTDAQRRIEFCAQHVTAERSFVVFRNGTCVIINEPNDDPIGTALALLRKTSAPDARFITRPIEADSYMVTYNEPIFHCLFADEVAQLAPVVDKSLDSFLTESERLAQPAGWEPPFDAKLGLVARTFLNTDARDQQVAKVIRAMPVPKVDYTSAQASTDPRE